MMDDYNLGNMPVYDLRDNPIDHAKYPPYPPDEPAARPDKKAVQQMVGDAILHTGGVLGVMGGLRDIFKSEEDVTRGIILHLSSADFCSATVKAELIIQKGCDVDAVLEEASANVANVLQKRARLGIEDVRLTLAEEMTPEEFEERCTAQNAGPAPQDV